MTSDKREKQREQARIRAQRLRNKRKASGVTTFPLTLDVADMARLDEVCRVFGMPDAPYTHTEALAEMISHFHGQIANVREQLGTCGKCGEQLPEGCANCHEGGLFKGDATCWHTTQRISIRELSTITEKGVKHV